MNVETMRAVDRYVGVPLAFLLTRWRKLVGRRASCAPVDTRRVLFVKLSEMGALVLAAPAFEEARRLFPNARVELLCFQSSAEIARVAGGFAEDELLTVDDGSLGTTLSGLTAAVRELGRRRYDVVIDLEYFSRVGALLTGLSAAPVRVGFHRFEAEGQYCGDLYTHRTAFNTYQHIATSMVGLVRASLADPEDVPLLKETLPGLDALNFPTFEPTDDDRARIDDLFAKHAIPDDAPVVVVNPNSSDLLPLRRWPEERFVELCHQILGARPDAWLVITGTEAERALGDRILQSIRARGDGAPQCVSWIGATSLRDLLTLFTRAQVLVSADSGPPHFAAMTEIRGVTLFGPETPDLYGPVTDRNTAVSLRLACSPCIHAWNRRVSACTDNQCMQRIETARVTQLVLDALPAG